MILNISIRITSSMRFIYQWFFPLASRKQFIQFCTKLYSAAPVKFSTSNIAKGELIPAKQNFVQFIADIQEAINEQAEIMVHIAHQPPPGKYVLKGGDKVKGNLVSLEITEGSHNGQLEFTGLSMHRCTINSGLDHVNQIVFQSCDIRSLSLNGACAVILKDCNIGHLHLRGVENLSVEGGVILGFTAPQPDGANPFRGSVIFSRTFILRKPMLPFIKGAQPYRNIRHYLMKIGNTQTANLFHSIELSIERASDPLSDKLLSYGYELLSDFGSSSIRPLLWIILFFTVSWCFVFITDGAILAFSDRVSYSGWRNILMQDTVESSAARSAYLVLESMVNPLGLFNNRSLLAPAFPWLAVWLSINSLLFIILTALAILAIRRRFKMQAG